MVLKGRRLFEELDMHLLRQNRLGMHFLHRLELSERIQKLEGGVEACYCLAVNDNGEGFYVEIGYSCQQGLGRKEPHCGLVALAHWWENGDWLVNLQHV